MTVEREVSGILNRIEYKERDDGNSLLLIIESDDRVHEIRTSDDCEIPYDAQYCIGERVYYHELITHNTGDSFSVKGILIMRSGDLYGRKYDI